MKRICSLIALTVILVIFTATLISAESIKPATMEKYRQAKVTLEQLSGTKAGIHARDILESAQRNLARAQENIDAKKLKETNQALDLVSLQIELAKARVEEREAAERTAVTRAKVDKLEKRLSDILTGKGDGK